MMIKRVLILICIISVNLMSAQKEVWDEYPRGQYFYAGGINELNKEMKRIVKEQNLLPCEKSEEIYHMKILVNENAKINYVKDFDTLGIEKNKCAFDFGRKIIPFLKRWIPAKDQGKYISAMATITIHPFFLYYSKDNPSENVKTDPVYKKGIRSFQNEIRYIFQKRINANEDKIATLTFVINEDGGMEDFVLSGRFSDSDRKEILTELSKIKGKWNPAMFNNTPVRSRMRLPLVQNFDMEQHIKEMNGTMNRNIYNNSYR